MRIAYIVHRFPTLSQTFILNQITVLIDNGHEVDIYADGSAKSDDRVHPDVDKYNLIDQTTYFNIPNHYFAQAITGLFLLCQKTLRRKHLLKIFLEHCKAKKKEALLPRWRAIHLFNCLIDKPAYDVIHCHFGPNGNKGALIKKYLFPESILATTFHGYDLTVEVNSDNCHHPYSQLFELCDLFLPISERWQRRLIELGCPAQKIKVHHMGVDIGRFAPDTDKNSDKDVEVISIARLSEKKGLQYGIRALKRVKDNYPNLHYSIIGDGPLRQTLEALIAELGLSDNVSLLGWKDQEEVVQLLAQSDILLAPSVTSVNGDQEGIPVVLMEAMAMKVPVISTWHSGIPELVKDKVSGLLVSERDTDAIAQSLILLANSQKMRTEMGFNGRKFIEENFNVRNLNYELTELFERLVESNLSRSTNDY